MLRPNADGFMWEIIYQALEYFKHLFLGLKKEMDLLAPKSLWYARFTGSQTCAAVKPHKNRSMSEDGYASL